MLKAANASQWYRDYLNQRTQATQQSLILLVKQFGNAANSAP
jgi:hypothetical protein